MSRRVFLGLIGTLLLPLRDSRASAAGHARQRALEAALQYIRSTRVRGLSCVSRNSGQPTRLDGHGLTFVAHFIARAAGDLLGERERIRLAARVRRQLREGGWGYSVNAPVDADDTAFALRALLDLGDAADGDTVVDGLRALKTFRVSGSQWFRTFHGVREALSVVRQGRAEANDQLHLCVNANIQALLARLDQATAQDLLTLWRECTDVASSKSFYYPFEMYTLSWVLPLVRTRLPGQTAKARTLVEGIVARQERDGSWASDPVETALACEALRPWFDATPTADETHDRGLDWLVDHQRQDGSWETERPLWVFPAQPDDEWHAFDSQRLVATALALKALRDGGAESPLTRTGPTA